MSYILLTLKSFGIFRGNLQIYGHHPNGPERYRDHNNQKSRWILFKEQKRNSEYFKDHRSYEPDIWNRTVIFLNVIYLRRFDICEKPAGFSDLRSNIAIPRKITAQTLQMINAMIIFWPPWNERSLFPTVELLQSSPAHAAWPVVLSQTVQCLFLTLWVIS